ncbi:hypothetical protein BBBGCB_BBBGCB_05335, partial [Dysosmobacter welbionis]
ECLAEKNSPECQHHFRVCGCAAVSAEPAPAYGNRRYHEVHCLHH